MDEIQHVRSNPAPGGISPRQATAPAPAPLLVNPAAVKTTSNYLRALRRRFWMVLAISVPMAIGAAILVLKMPPVYLATTEIEINPPEIDPALSALVTHDIGRRDSASAALYVPIREGWLRSKWLHERVVSDPGIVPEANQSGDSAIELFKSLVVTQWKKTNRFIVSLESNDPARAKKLLDTLLDKFKEEVTEDNSKKLVATTQFAQDSLKKLRGGLAELDSLVDESLRKTRTLGPGGRSILEEKYVNLGTILQQKTAKLDEIQQQKLYAEMFPKFQPDPRADAREGRIAQLEAQAKKHHNFLLHMKRTIRNFNSDPAVQVWAKSLDDILDELEALRSIKTEMAASPTEMLIEQYNREIENDRIEHEKLLGKMQDSIPEHQRVLALLRDREEKARQVARAEEKLADFEILKRSVVSSDCVRIPPSGVAEPTAPTKPNRPMLIVLGLLGSFLLGIGLVCLLEHVDHSVKVPEHVAHGLTLALLGVVPRIRRTALTQRGGHLWTSGTPDSIEADAYRNVRASLLGITDKRGPIVTLLVTSAKAGEGKSTTALNLAATCARAGERTLLLDVDLRRPSLAEVFIDDQPPGEVHGLVDVLRGELPWQRTVRHTEIPNLDFIPTGETRAIPIEILGTRELRQVLLAVSHHYDRVILDGPAVLGLADCRVLGRIVDAALLVVRSGSHQLMTLHRAKTMLEQSHVVIAGVVFNGLTEDMDNWSSYGYEPLPPAGIERDPWGQERRRSSGIEMEQSDESSVAMAGSVET
ncbi:MAG: polysaccharide biosynthesis tyrosine autokinase [Isosphaeraceae bacterium]